MYFLIVSTFIQFWKQLINSQINSTVKVRTEPRVFCPSKSNLQNNASESNINWSLMPSLGNLGFQFRAKTVDLFIDLSKCPLINYFRGENYGIIPIF